MFQAGKRYNAKPAGLVGGFKRLSDGRTEGRPAGALRLGLGRARTLLEPLDAAFAGLALHAFSQLLSHNGAQP